MAYIKIFAIKATVKKAMDYITNPDKTDEQLLVSSFGCSPETAEMEFEMTREMGQRNVMEKGSNLAFHLIQSFKPGEISDPRLAHEIGKQFADAVLKGKYEYVISTHVDRDHVHNHIIFNATSFVTNHKYTTNKRNYYKLRSLSDRICAEHGLSVIGRSEHRGRSYKENMEYNRGNSWKARLKIAVDKAVWSSVNMDEFLMKMELAGYEIRRGKYLAFRAPEQKHFTNVKTLGAFYTEDNLRQRLEKNRRRVRAPRQITREVRLFIDISGYVSAGNRAGFECWAKLNNLKEAARTFNYLSEHNLLNYEDFSRHIEDVAESIKAADQQIAQTGREIETQRIIRKHCDSYRRCRDIVEKGKTSPDPAAWKAEYAAEYQLHKILKQTLLELGVQKIPDSTKLQAKIESLEASRAALIQEKQDLQKEQKTLQVIRANFAELAGQDLSAPEHEFRRQDQQELS